MRLTILGVLLGSLRSEIGERSIETENMLVLVDEQFLFEAPHGQCLNGVGQFPVIRFRVRFEEAEVVF
jgi:hypothetical protein